MSYRKKINYFIVLCLFAYSSLSFSSNYNISDIVIAKSTGVWSKEKDYGYFKVFVYRNGLEHAKDVIRVLITKVDTKNNNQNIIKDIKIDSPGIKGYVQDLSLAIVNNKLSLGVDIEMKAMENIILKESLLINLDGKVKVIMPAKYIDIYQ